jgi:two-component system chemotaxis response regulator CheB
VTRILIVDDSLTSRIALRKLFERAGAEFEVVDHATNATEAEARAVELAPDLITMDLHLGAFDGVELGRRILSRIRTRIVIVTSADTGNRELLFRALSVGALDVLAKPSAPTVEGPSLDEARFIRAIRALASVPLRVKNYTSHAPRPQPDAPAVRIPPQTRAVQGAPSAHHPPPRFPVHSRVLVGISTGGPPLLESMLQRLDAPLAVPWVIVQHIASGFGPGFAEWLARSTGHPVCYCVERTVLEPGTVYVARDDMHLGMSSSSVVRPIPAADTRLSVPSIDVLFESAVAHDPEHTLALLMTGMGADGALGMAKLRAAGASTVAQDPESCVVGSMPRAAITAGAAAFVMSPNAIVAALGGTRTP